MTDGTGGETSSLQPSPAEWHACFSLLRAVAEADGEVTNLEEVYIGRLSAAWGVPSSEDLTAIITGAARVRLDAIASRSFMARLAIREAAGMAAADGEVTASEKDVVLDAASALNLSEAFVDRCLSWAQTGYHWQAEGIRLIKERPE